ncbi:SDR family NAD(P)-dependent oxidoreductase [Spirochaeta thermophila]|uniref:Oxidoreductase, short chain dehydrogenase/reductase family n=1 Tax=Winmispira thermophila (strain ATCC 49972 / DSM 6192 / RI 19.B1) TaxID=665571 RepID=E0RQP1_WINT6|nr:SDR family NAD(P)-dependent oxidoreductase [Spirochaeta thermophila]ADN01545.1 oxidoreductase, short chain dehydrogenase/reductase family [Spirochaeta thermophila DSM 6192]
MQILVTGARRGLGRALVETFLERGHSVHALGRSLSKELEALVEAHPDRCFFYAVDVTEESQLEAVRREVGERVDAIDILVNNAGVHLEQDRPDLSRVDFSVYLPTFLTNSVAPLMVIRAFLDLILRSPRKWIANISSEAGSIGNCWRESEYSYCMSKAALNMATRILQNRLGKEGAVVRSIHPGWFSSDMGGAAAPITPEQAAAKVADVILTLPEHPLYVDLEGKALPW